MEMNEEVSDVDGGLEEEYSNDRNVHVKRFLEGNVDGIFKEQWGKERDPSRINRVRWD